MPVGPVFGEVAARVGRYLEVPKIREIFDVLAAAHLLGGRDAVVATLAGMGIYEQVAESIACDVAFYALRGDLF